MIEKRFMISDASKKVEVESHVLRYWEEELELDILRNEMGHRYYTEDDIKLFRKVKELKDQGFQLKAIKMIIPDIKKNENLIVPLERTKVEPAEETGVKMEQFRKILGNCIGEALRENNTLLGKEVSGRVSENVMKEMDYLFRVNDEKEEERYKKLDETIRNYQKTRQEIAAAKMEEKGKKKGKISSFFIK